MDTESLWQATCKRTQKYPQLNKDIEVDVAIVGGGITGVTCAIQLLAAGKTVAILESCKTGGVVTGSSTGNLYVPVQPYYQKIAQKFNFDTAKAIALSRQLAIDYIENHVKAHTMKCHFHRRPWFAYTNGNPEIDIDKELELFKRMGIEADYTKELPLDFKFQKAITMPNQARIHPLQYVIDLAEAVSKKGGLIFEDTHVLSLEEKERCLLKTDKATVTAKDVIMATHTPLGINMTQFYIAPYRSYAVAVRLTDQKYPEGHLWDIDSPHHATCTHPDKGEKPELVIVAGSHHKTGQTKDNKQHFKDLEKFLRQHLPVSEVAYIWSAQHFQSADTAPYIGLASRSAKHTYMATGYFADGLVYGTLAGIIIPDLILKKENPLASLYTSRRFKPFASAAFLATEDLNVMWQYMKDFPLPKQKDYADLKKGEGRIVNINREKCAVCRDANNELHIVSATCTHMGCTVQWNNAECTWDCPCHGSRFYADGRVLEGPALTNLEKKNPEKKQP